MGKKRSYSHDGITPALDDFHEAERLGVLNVITKLEEEMSDYQRTNVWDENLEKLHLQKKRLLKLLIAHHSSSTARPKFEVDSPPEDG